MQIPNYVEVVKEKAGECHGVQPQGTEAGFVGIL